MGVVRLGSLQESVLFGESFVSSFPCQQIRQFPLKVEAKFIIASFVA